MPLIWILDEIRPACSGFPSVPVRSTDFPFSTVASNDPFSLLGFHTLSFTALSLPSGKDIGVGDELDVFEEAAHGCVGSRGGCGSVIGVSLNVRLILGALASKSRFRRMAAFG
jgi:hypothetical protein